MLPNFIPFKGTLAPITAPRGGVRARGRRSGTRRSQHRDWPDRCRQSRQDGRDARPTIDLRGGFKGTLNDHMHVDAGSLSAGIFQTVMARASCRDSRTPDTTLNAAYAVTSSGSVDTGSDDG